MKNYKEVKKLLSKGSTNAKTAKNDIETFILYLAPHTQNSKGKNICKDASKGCIESCLNSAGRGVFSNVKQSRINKANYYVYDKVKFLTQLSKEIIKETNKAKKVGKKIVFRLNGTSDLDFIYLLNKHTNLDIETLKDTAKFYDYTKSLPRAKRYRDHKNYTLTFSKSETNHKETIEALNYGLNIAAVFGDGLPKKYKGFKVVDGDKSDLEMLKYKNVILGLKAKGQAKKDTSGFVIYSDPPFNFL